MRLIDADAYQFPGDLIDEPTIDAVPVVRCRDCKSYCPESITVVKHCVLTGVSVDDNDFCSYGERK